MTKFRFPYIVPKGVSFGHLQHEMEDVCHCRHNVLNWIEFLPNFYSITNAGALGQMSPLVASIHRAPDSSWGN